MTLESDRALVDRFEATPYADIGFTPTEWWRLQELVLDGLEAQARIEELEAALGEITESTGYSYSGAVFQVEDIKGMANKALQGKDS